MKITPLGTPLFVRECYLWNYRWWTLKGSQNYVSDLNKRLIVIL